MAEMTMQDIFPEVLKYENFLQDSINKNKKLTFLSEETEKVATLMNKLVTEAKKLQENIVKLYSISSIEEKSKFCSDEMKNIMQSLRETVDELEGMLPKEYWPMPTYSEILN